MLRYNLKDLIPKSLYPKRQDKPLDNPVINREIASAQRIIEGQNFDMRKPQQILDNYGASKADYLETADGYFTGQGKNRFLQKQLPKKYNMLLPVAGLKHWQKLRKRLYFI